MNISRLEEIRASGDVIRYHAAPLLRTQNVAQHTYGVVMILLELKPDASPELIRAALLHDFPELYTGDTPSISKWRYPELEEVLRRAESEILATIDYPVLAAEDRLLIKFADMLEGAMFCVENAEHGDPVGARIAHRFLEAATKRGAREHAGALKLIERLEARLRGAGTASYTLINGQEL